MSGEEVVEFDADLEARIAEEVAVQREPIQNLKRHRFAELETLAKRLVGGVEYINPKDLGGQPKHGVFHPRGIGARRAFDMAEDFLHERDRRKKAAGL